MRKLLATTALLTAAATASAATWEVTPTEHLLGRAANPPSVLQINPAPSFDGDTGDIPLATCTYNDVTQVLACEGVLHFRSVTSEGSPFGRVFDRYITDLNINLDTGDPSGTAAYVCENVPGSSQAGGFGQIVGANICGNYLLNGADDSTMTYGPGLEYNREIGGNDVAAGDPQTIADYALTLASFTPGPEGELVIQSDDWDAVSSAGTQITFTVGEEVEVDEEPVVNDDEVGVLEGSTDNIIDVLANDTNLPDNVTVVITDGPQAAGSTASVNVDNTIQYSPDPELTVGAEETITYTVLDAEENEVGSAVLTITIEENLLPVAPDGSITISSQNGSTTAGTVNVATLEGYSPGNAPATVAIVDNGNPDGTCTVNNTTISFTRAAGFVAGGDTATCTYTVTDNGGDVSEEGTITITITDVQPVVNNGSASGEVGDGELVATGSFTAGNGSAAQHEVEVTDGDCTAEISGGNVVVTYGDDSTVGEFSCEVTVTDADGDEDTATFTFTVEEATVEDDRPRLPGGGGAMDLWSLMLLGGLPLLGLRRRRS
jgi:hypothetical protein